MSSKKTQVTEIPDKKSRGKADTQTKIVEAALACVHRWGVEKVTLNDIAREAGVTRPTVYSYFKTRDDVIRYALLQSAYGFADKLMKEIQKYDTPQDRLLAACLFALERLPKEPYLEMVTDKGLSKILNEHALNTPQGMELIRGLFRFIYSDVDIEDEELEEVSEITVRLMLSFLTIESQVKRTTEEMRSFLQRRLFPAIGLV